MTNKKAAVRRGPNQTVQTHSTKKPGKLESMLRRFATGARFHRFEAERIGDHCLHTTVSALQTKHGIEFEREFVKVPNRFGSETAVKQYWLAGQNLEKARQIVGVGVAAA